MTYFTHLTQYFQLGPMHRRILICLLWSWTAMLALPAQAENHPLTGCAITGTSPVNQLGVYTYSINVACIPNAVSNWTISCGSILSTTQTSVTVVFNEYDCGWTSEIKAFDGNGGTIASKIVTINVPSPLDGGSISTTSQTINYNTTPGPISASPAQGGSCPDGYLYQWDSSPDGVNWSGIYDGTGYGQNYTPGALTVTTYFRRLTNCGSQNAETSDTAVVNVYPRIIPGTISPSTQDIINYNASALPLSISNSGGGNGTYSCQWQSLPNGATIWGNVGSPGTNYTPGPLTVTTQFRVAVFSNEAVEYSDTVSVNVYPLLSASINPVSQSINYNTVPQSLGAAPQGGDQIYSYQWYSDSTGTFQPIAGATINNYTPGALKATTHYFIVVSSNGVSATSTTATVTVAAPPSASDLNYIITRTVKKPGVADKLTAGGLSDINEVQQSTTYFDGLGRSIQTVLKQASPLGNDMVAPQVYDAFGREAMHYLPYVSPSSDGNYKPDPLGEQSAFNSAQFPGEQYYYGRTDFEPSPLNRPLAVYGAGNSWIGANKGMSTQYLVNTSTDSIQIWNIALTVGSFPVNAGTYPAGQLYMTTTTDEQQHTVVEYKDKDGHVVLKKVQLWDTPAAGPSGWLNTYYVYDDLDNLRFVIPPKAVEWLVGNTWNFSASGGDQVASELCFRYEYDARNRMVIKKVPGAGEVDMVYDMIDRLVFTQDANQRTQGQWLSMQYDALDRQIVTGLMTYPISRDGMQQLVTGQTTSEDVSPTLPANLDLAMPDETGDSVATNNIYLDPGFSSLIDGSFSAMIVPGGYSNSSYMANGLPLNLNPIPSGVTVQPLTINYYDNYDWVAGTGSGLGTALATDHIADGDYFITTYNTTPTYAVPVIADPNARGQITGTMHLVLGENRPLYTVNFYDDRSRLIQARSMNYTGGIDTLISQYDFSGKLLRNLLTHYKGGHTAQYHTVLTKMDYDANFRVTNIWNNIDGAASDQLICNMQYDELGQLKTKTLGNGLDNVINEYNIRGWLTGINKGYVADTARHYFGMELAYDKTTSVTTGPNYTLAAFNGNIAGMVWRSAGDGVDRKYDFSYDNVNRLTAADFNQKFTGGWGKSDPGGSGAAMDYSVSNLKYDANGNIQSMKQNGFKIGAPASPIDQLAYSYLPNSNKLLQVADTANDPDSKLGDFHVKGTIQPTGYDYDANGNLKLDNNKGIDQISYNYLNLPEQIHVTGKGTIRYTYDATGSKMTKVTTDDVSGVATTTLYLDGFQYQRRSAASNPDGGADSLQFAGHEEGRARWAFHKYLNGQSSYGWEYDFYEKDHLGNTRVLLTQEKDTAQYLATMEAAYRNTEKALFFGLDTSVVSRASAGYPNDVSITSPNDSVTVLNGSGIKQGPAIILKVMSGDSVDLSVRYFYNNAGSTAQAPLAPDDLLGGLAGGLFSITGGTHGAISDLTSGTSPLAGALNSWVNDPNIPAAAGKPRAYLNWILLDNQFRYVGGMVGANSQSGALQVGDGGTVNGQLQLPLAVTKLPISKSGYLYIYLSNVTEHQDVFFDNLSVIHYSGPLVEENHYYPFGLQMSGISDKALKSNYAENKYRFNKGSELQNKEFSDGSGLELYATNYRSLDPQLGRFWQIDPLLEISEDVSPYGFASNNPIINIDPWGLIDTTINGQKVQRDKDLQSLTVTGHKNNNTSTFLPFFPSRMSTDHSVARPNINASLRFIPAEQANAASGYKQPPYMKGTMVTRYKSSVSGKYVRVFDSKNPKSNAIGRWIMRYSEVKNMSAAQIKDRFALEFTPDKMVEVDVPSNQNMEASFAGPNEWGSGGGVQYRILEENLNPEWFGGPMNIPVPETISPFEMFKTNGRMPLEEMPPIEDVFPIE